LRARARAALPILAAAGAWVGLALLFGVTTSLTYMSTGRPPRWGLTISMALADWGVWAALSWPVLAIARRFPLRRGTLLRHLPLHALASGAIALIKVIADRWIRAHLFGFGVSYFLISNLAPYIVIYWTLVGAAHGLTYYRAGRERELRASQLEARLAETRLQLLQMQLQPHFLFNTLNTIAELVHENPEAADRMIAGLSGLLREALASSGSRDVPLSREIGTLRQYVDIQTTRFGDRLQVAITCEGAASDARVPALVLQPLVENAIRHGPGPCGGTLRVGVSARRRGDRLLIEVCDNGRGLPENGGVQEGIGLSNTRARLQELYGQAYSLDIRARAEGGVAVVLALPIAPGGAQAV
jgi:signal transduction histidine kinase